MQGIGKNRYALFRIIVMVDPSKKKCGVFLFLHYDSHCSITVEHNQSGWLKY